MNIKTKQNIKYKRIAFKETISDTLEPTVKKIIGKTKNIISLMFFLLSLCPMKFNAPKYSTKVAHPSIINPAISVFSKTVSVHFLNSPCR